MALQLHHYQPQSEIRQRWPGGWLGMRLRMGWEWGSGLGWGIEMVLGLGLGLNLGLGLTITTEQPRMLLGHTVIMRFLSCNFGETLKEEQKL